MVSHDGTKVDEAFHEGNMAVIPEVVNMRTCSPPWGQPGDVRIDRRTKWGNIFVMERESDRDAVCYRYSVYLKRQIALGQLDLIELKDAKRLGCWCKPKRCHGDEILKAMQEQGMI